MSKNKRILIITLLTLTVIIFSVYVFNVVLQREDFRAVDIITVIFTILAILKNIQLIILEVKHNGKR